jgi:PhoPQ-activated pathogenicity-related protein
MSQLHRSRLLSVLVWLFKGIAILEASRLAAGETALDRYVSKPDPTYSWKVVRTASSNALTQYIVDLKSQTWRTEADVDRPVWQHWLTIVKPARPVSKLAFLRITGGANGGDPPASAEAATIRLAEATNSVVAELKMVPNQPLVMHQDGVRRSEDDFIAYTWDQFIKTGDETWPARLPMVKSAVRAMDCVPAQVKPSRPTPMP